MEQIAIARHDRDAPRDPGGERADHVFGFITGMADGRYLQELEDLEQDRHLWFEKVFGLFLRATWLGPERLVRGEQCHAPFGTPIFIVGATDVVGVVVLDQSGEHAEEPVSRVDRFAVRRPDRIGRREERPIDKARCVDQQGQAFSHPARVGQEWG